MASWRKPAWLNEMVTMPSLVSVSIQIVAGGEIFLMNCAHKEMVFAVETNLRRVAGVLTQEGVPMVKFLFWCILFVLCWPLALGALVIYPILWVLLLPLRIVGIAVGSVLALVWAVVILPVKVARAIV